MNSYTIHGECPAVHVSWHAEADEQHRLITGRNIALCQNDDNNVSVDVGQVEELITALRFAAQLAREIEFPGYRDVS